MFTPRKVSLLAVLAIGAIGAIGGIITPAVGFAAPASALPQTCATGSVTLDAINYNLAADCTASVGNNTRASGVVTIPRLITSSGDTYVLTSIVDDAFYGNSNLSGVVLPSSLTSIGSEAFAVTGLRGKLDLSALTSLTSISSEAFSDISFVTDLALPSSLTSIGGRAFSLMGLTGTLDLSALTLLTSIDGNAFFGISGLNKAIFPASLTSIGPNAFDGGVAIDATFLGALPVDGYSVSFTTGTVLHYCGADSSPWFGFSVVPQCSVAFVSEFGTDVPPETVAYGAVLIAPIPPTRPGYDFSGWVTAPSGLTPFTFGTATANATAYASWVESPAAPAELASTGRDGSLAVSFAALLLAVGSICAAGVIRTNRRRSGVHRDETPRLRSFLGLG